VVFLKNNKFFLKKTSCFWIKDEKGGREKRKEEGGRRKEGGK
jgi:hypothetical protein